MAQISLNSTGRLSIRCSSTSISPRKLESGNARHIFILRKII